MCAHPAGNGAVELMSREMTGRTVLAVEERPGETVGGWEGCRARPGSGTSETLTGSKCGVAGDRRARLGRGAMVSVLLGPCASRSHCTCGQCLVGREAASKG